MISKGGKKYPLPGTLESNRVHNFFSCVAEFIPLLLVSDILGGMYNLAMNKRMQRKVEKRGEVQEHTQMSCYICKEWG